LIKIWYEYFIQTVGSRRNRMRVGNTEKINVFATALAAAARDAGKFSPVLLDQMPNFDTDSEFAGHSGEFCFDRIPNLVAMLPRSATWRDIHSILQEEIRGYVLLHPEDANGPTIGRDGRIHCPPGTVDLDIVYFCC
jgi:hypothetical protein